MDAIPAITYHQVLSEAMPVRERKPGEGVLSGQIYLKEFIQHMDYLAEEGFTTITHDQLYKWQTGNEKLGPKPIVIDFDDHSMISYINALPVMRERGQVATMYTISGVADGDPTLPIDMWSIARMRWSELEVLIEAGWEIGAHTRTHLYLTTVPQGSQGDAQIMRELVQGLVDIEINLGVTLNDISCKVTDPGSLIGAKVLASLSELRYGLWDALEKTPIDIIPRGSIAYKLALLAGGLVDATISLAPKNEWDVAAGVLLVQAAGGKVTDLNGDPIRFNQADTLLNGVIAAGPRTWDMLWEILH